MYFFRMKSSYDFSVNFIFGKSFLCTFDCNHGVLNLRLQVLALPGLYGISHRRHFTPGHVTPVHSTHVVSPHVRFTAHTFHPTYVSPHVRFAPRTFHPTYISPHVLFTPRAFHPKDMSLRIIELMWPNNILYKPVEFMKIIMPIG